MQVPVILTPRDQSTPLNPACTIESTDTVATVLAKTQVAQAWLNPPNEGTTAPDATPPFVLRVSAHIPEQSPPVQTVFKPAFRRLTAMSHGRITVADYWGGVRHPERAGIEALQSGLTDLCPVYSAWDPALFPAAQVLSLPGLFPSTEVATQVAEELYRDYFSGDFEGQGILMGRMVATSAYNLFSRAPIRTLEDLQGIRMACSDGLESRIFAALGAIPVACSTPAAKDRFKSGAVDAVSISDSAAHTVGIYQDARFRTAANLVRVNLEYGLSKQFFAHLPDDLKVTFNTWLRGLAQATAQIFYGLAGARACEVFAAAGLESITLEPAELARWNARLGTIEDDFIAELEANGFPGRRMIARLQERIAQHQTHSSDELMMMTQSAPLTDLVRPA